MSQRMSVQAVSRHLTLEVIHLGKPCELLQQEESALPFPLRQPSTRLGLPTV